MAKDEAEAQGEYKKAVIKAALRGTWDHGFPTDMDEKEAYFMSMIGRGEVLCQDGEFCSSTVRL